MVIGAKVGERGVSTERSRIYAVAAAVLRIVFGLHFLINGVNFYFDLIPINAAPNPEAGRFIEALVSSGLIEVVKVVEVVVGMAMLANIWVPLAAVVAMPVSIGVAFTDIVLVGGWFAGGVLGLGTLLLNAGFILAYYQYFRPFLKPRSVPFDPASDSAI